MGECNIHGFRANTGVLLSVHPQLIDYVTVFYSYHAWNH